MKGYPFLITGFMVVLLGAYFAVDAAGVAVLSDPGPLMLRSGVWAGVIGVGLLAVDVVLPVPSSLVMVAHGAVFGFWGGASLSVVGGTVATGIGFGIGRRSQRLVRRWTKPSQRARADRLLQRWGWVAVAATRPVPVLAETVAILAGTSPVRWPTAVMAGAVGHFLPAVAYAWAGTMSAGVVGGAWVFAGVLVLVALIAGVAALGRARADPQNSSGFRAGGR